MAPGALLGAGDRARGSPALSPTCVRGEQGVGDAGSRAGEARGASAASGTRGPQAPPEPPGSARPDLGLLRLGRLTLVTPGREALVPARRRVAP